MVSEIFLKFCKNVKQHEITCRTHFIFDRVLTLEVSAVARHGAVLAALLFFLSFRENKISHFMLIDCCVT